MRRRSRRIWWLAAAIALAAFAVFEVVVHDLGPLPIVVFLLLPDLPAVLVLLRLPAASGATPALRRADQLTHRLASPLALIAVALAWLLAVRLLVVDADRFEAARAVPLRLYTVGIAWLVHLAVDRALDRRLTP